MVVIVSLRVKRFLLTKVCSSQLQVKKPIDWEVFYAISGSYMFITILSQRTTKPTIKTCVTNKDSGQLAHPVSMAKYPVYHS